MSSLKDRHLWSEHVHDSVIKPNKSGQLNLTIKGGAEESCFPYFDSVKQEKVTYERCVLFCCT